MKGAKRPDCRIRPGAKLSLASLPTEVELLYDGDDDARQKLAAQVAVTAKWQEALYAEGRRALLVVLQARDAAGKDSCIENVFSGVNPQGCVVTSFKQPSREELDHDFLWRCTRALPARGQIGVFNRSYYEEVLVVRVHPQLLDAQRLPGKPGGPGFWKERFESIRRFEEHLGRNGTRVLKLHLHLSRREQAKRFIARMDDPHKSWKFSAADVEEREHWDAYRDAYEDLIAATSTEDAPWHVVPADDKKNARLIVSSIVNEALAEMDPQYPQPTAAQRAEIERCRELLKRQGAAR